MRNLEAPSCTIGPRAGSPSVSKVVSIPSVVQGQFNTKWELLLSDTAPRVSTICLPDVTARDQISQAFPSVFAYCKQSNTGGGNGLGTR